MCRVVTDIDGVLFRRRAELIVAGHLPASMSDTFVIDQVQQIRAWNT
jgi:hypothetical protein